MGAAQAPNGNAMMVKLYLRNGRFPDSDETTGEARQNRDIECPEIPSGNHDTVNRTGDEFPDTNRC